MTPRDKCPAQDLMLIQQRLGQLVPGKREEVQPSAKQSAETASSVQANNQASTNAAAPVALLAVHAEDQSRARLSARNDELHSQMAAMMADDDDDDLEKYMSDARGAGGAEVGEEYMAESDKELSSALGSRWNSAELESNANHNSKALLEGIGGKKAMGALQGMVSGMMQFR